MKREDILAILENAELDNSARLQKILDLNGNDINAKNQRIKTLEDAAATHAAELEAERGKYKDYDSIVQERNTLKAEKERKAFEDRFTSVLGNNKPKNEFTKKGLIDLFESELAKPENAEKKDSEIFEGMIKGKEKEFFEANVRLNMSHTNPSIKRPENTEAFLDEMYKDNPYYKKMN
jgi:hypothetical protein